ncbi:MAG: FAD-dependent oxidoreductase, partial [Verrucomicrobia bacterium]|nr:FAD-dependent oxidoreductase [Verrucomicrobiota bacterium]
NANRASNIPVTIRHAGGETKVTLDEKKKPAVDGLLQPVGTFDFKKGRDSYVEISNAGTDGYVVIDAVQWVEAKP